MRRKLILLACILFCAVFNAIGAQDTAPPLSFFAENGVLKSHIIVGSGAAAQDVASATQMATFLGTLLYETEDATVGTETYISEHEDIPVGVMVIDSPLDLESLWFQDRLPWGNYNKKFDPWETHEEIRVTPQDLNELVSGTLAPDGLLELVGSEQSIKLPGVLYAADNVRICPHIWVDQSKPIFGYSHCTDLDWFGTVRYPLPDPEISPPGFVLLGEYYQVIDAGFFRDFIVEMQVDDPSYSVPIGYCLTGEAVYFFEEYIDVGEERQYRGMLLRLIDVDVDHNKAYIEISDVNLGTLFSGYMVLDPQHGFSPKLQEMAPSSAPHNAIAVGRSQHDVTTISNTQFYVDDEGLTHYQYSYVTFAVDGVAIFTGAAQKHYGLQCNVYVLDNYYLFRDQYCCVPFSDQIFPWSMGLYFSTTKQPETLYDTNNYYEAWPPILQDLETEDWLGYYYYALNATDFQFEIVLGLCETVQVPDCETEYVFTGPENYYLGTVEFTLDVPYFSVTFTDITAEKGFDFYVSQEVSGEILTLRQTSLVDLTLIVYLDVQYDFTHWKTEGEYNLILIGGPVANIIVKQLGDAGMSWVDWVTSPGEWEWLISPFNGADVLIIAGSDRDATAAATIELLNAVRASA